MSDSVTNLHSFQRYIVLMYLFISETIQQRTSLSKNMYINLKVLKAIIYLFPSTYLSVDDIELTASIYTDLCPFYGF